MYKGQKVTTYGGSYKFKNGKRYFRIGGPAKQYVKSSNLGSVISPNASTNNKEETTVTVTAKYTYLCTEVPGKAVVQVTKKRVKKGDKFVVDRLEQGSRAGTGQDGDDDNELAIYHIKGTKYWIYSNNVQAAKQLPVHDYNKITSAYITFPKDTDVYNADGTIQDHNGQKISRQKGWLKVDKLVYIWVPSENKAELFYHLVGTSFYASTTPTARKSRIEVGHNAYVKANDVKAIDVGLKLTPSNTAAEAEAAAKKVKLKC